MPQPSRQTFFHLISRSRRGRLKIYLGYSPGVGKTYHMLQEGLQLKAQEVDVVIGFIETSGRYDIHQLLQEFEAVPPKSIRFRNVEIDEMDVDAILKRRPSVVLIDELAHTNAPGSRHDKRYQDIQALRDEGIHIITTLNIQHLESLYDTVEHLIGIRVKDRLPDVILTDADQLVNIDLSAEDLQQRLKDGKIFPYEIPEPVEKSFFNRSNLEQLRELTARQVAAYLERKSRSGVTDYTIKSRDEIVVCLSPNSTRRNALLRYASRMAGRLNRNWYALHIQTNQKDASVKNPLAYQRSLTQTFKLAKDLGATVFNYQGQDVIEIILRFVKEHNIGHVILGRPPKKTFWQWLTFRKNVLERLLQKTEGINIVIADVNQSTMESKEPEEETSDMFLGNVG